MDEENNYLETRLLCYTVKLLTTRIVFCFPVPEENPVFRVTDVQKHTVALTWEPPLVANGVVTGYRLEYQLSVYNSFLFPVELQSLPCTSLPSFNVTSDSLILPLGDNVVLVNGATAHC
jgi:hypothetical protein